MGGLDTLLRARTSTVGSQASRRGFCAYIRPRSGNPFVPFDLNKEDHAPEHGELTGGLERDSGAAEAFAAYRDAYLAYVDEDDRRLARQKMDQARHLQPDEPLYHCLSGLLAIADNDPEPAFQAFSQALGTGHTDTERMAAFHLWQKRTSSYHS